MPSIDEVLNSFKQATLPLLDDLKGFLSPFAGVLPDRRYGLSLVQFVPGMLAARSPQVSQAAAHAPERKGSSWSLSRCIYRLLDTPRFSHRAWLKQLYADARRVAEMSGIVAMVPHERTWHDPAVAAARAGLGEETFAVAWAAGRAMTLEEAVAYTLEETP